MNVSVEQVAKYACDFVVGFTFGYAVCSVLITFLWAWLAFLLTMLLTCACLPALEVVSDAAYNKSTDAAAWCIRKFRQFNTPKVA